MLGLTPSSWAFCTEAVDSAPTQASFGVDFTIGASDSMGTAVEVFSALSHDVELLELWIAAEAVSASVKRSLCDLLIDPAGGSSWSVLIAALLVPPWNTLDPLSCVYRFPLWVPAGASIGIRGANATGATANGHITARAYGGPSRPERWWCGAGVESLGYNYTGSKGTLIPCAAGSFGSWTNVGSTTGKRYGALQVGTGGPDSLTSYSNRAYWAQVGIGANVFPCGRLSYMAHSIEMCNSHRIQIEPGADIPAGTQMQMRAHASAGTENTHHTLYGVY